MEAAIVEAIDAIRPALQMDGGDIELVGVNEEGVVQVKLTGACDSCSISCEMFASRARSASCLSGPTDAIRRVRTASVAWSNSWRSNCGGMSVIFAQKCGRFVHDTNGSNSGLNVSTVNCPRPRCAVITSGLLAEPTSTWPSRNVPVATCNG